MPYIVVRDGDAAAPVGLWRVIGQVGVWGKRGGPKHRYRQRDNQWSERITLPHLLAKLTLRLPLAKVGDIVGIIHATDVGKPIGYSIRKSKRRPRHRDLIHYTGSVVDLSDGNPRIAEVGQWAADNYVRVRCAGYAYTRKVSGSTAWSQHSRFPTGTNAIDLTFYRGDESSGPVDVPALDLFVQALVREARIGSLELRRIIYQDRDYRLDHGWAPIPYTGVYHGSHTHAEAEPFQTATPVDA